MVPTRILQKHYYQFTFVVVFVVFLVVMLVAYVSETTAREALHQRITNTLAFQTATLKASMEKYAILSTLVARRPDIIQALAQPGAGPLPQADKLAAFSAGVSGAGDVWVVDKDGVVLASNQDNDIFRNVSQREFFQQAMQGSLGRGSTFNASGQRFYIFASPVFNQDNVVGAVIVRVDLQFIEQVWVLLEDSILATDANNRVLLASEQSWRLKTFTTDNSEESSLIAAYRDNTGERIFMGAPSADGERDFLQVSRYIPLLNWELYILADYQPAIARRNTAVLISLLVIMVLVMGVILALNARRRQIQEKRSQQAFAMRLERQVRDRTHDLTNANIQLQKEIEERRQAEKNLRETQEELVQAAKLAGIGQMSTALAHEYNQPLAAIHSYADNCVAFMEREQWDPVKDNLHRISLLTDKMASMTRTLRNFATKSSADYHPVPLERVMDELLILLGPQAKKQHVSLMLHPPESPVTVIGETGRLTQIMTNLVVNAMDAVQSRSQQQVDILWYAEGDRAHIRVRDTGPGISEAVRENMFNAFYSTKSTGAGMGLGLFIVMNLINDLKGSLALVDEDGYGAVFDVSLPLVS